MKCAEVMEWMHRYLDQDLSRDEIIEMFRHIDDCPSCAEVFERLSLLSKELEQLPDVLPPFSLVDSILPQLAELDLNTNEVNPVTPKESVVIPFERDSSRRKPSKRNSVAARTGIGAIAAAVILGIAIFNMPEQMPGAEMEYKQQESAALDSADTSRMASKSNAAPANADEASAVNSGVNEGDSQGVTAAPPEPTMDDKGAASDQVVGNVEPNTPADASPNTSAFNAPLPTQEEANSKKPKESREPNKREVVTQVQTPDSGNDASDQARVSSMDQSYDMDNDSAADVASSLMMEDSADPAYDYARGIIEMKVAPDSTIQTWTSPDEKYAVEFIGLQIVIYKNSTSGTREDRTAVTSYPLIGSWVSGEWSADSSQFTYVTEKDGVTSTKVYTVMEAGLNSSTPSASPTITSEH